jgi:hypothetical protein
MSCFANKDVSEVNVACQDPDDNVQEGNAYQIQVYVHTDEAAALVAQYDNSDPNSPSEALSRELARIILRALEVKLGG